MRNPSRLFGCLIPAGVLLVLAALTTCSAVHVVEPGHRGVVVTLGKVSPEPLHEGVNYITPLITDIVDISIKQETDSLKTQCYSSDLQQVNVTLKALYRIPEEQVVPLYRGYAGAPFESLIAPRIVEGLKEVVAELSAERVVKDREKVKKDTLERTKKKIGDLIELNDLVIENIDLSDQLEQAIEAKMVQDQEAQKAKYAQEKAKIEAETLVIKAKAEAESIKMQGEALRLNPDLIAFRIVEKWDGRAPLVIGGGTGPGASNMIFPVPIRELESAARERQAPATSNNK